MRLLEKMNLEFKRNGCFKFNSLGLDLPKQQQELLKSNKKRMSELSINFSKNLSEDQTEILFTRKELNGLPNDFIDGLTTTVKDNEEMFIVTMKYPDLLPGNIINQIVLKMAKSEETRQRLDFISNNRCLENIPILEEVIILIVDNQITTRKRFVTWLSKPCSI